MEEKPKITAVKKEKDPKRVEAGRRLAAISKSAREKKMREKIESELKEQGWNINYGYVFGAVGVLIAIVSLYQSRKEGETLRDIKEDLEHVVIKEPKSTFKLDTLD